MAKWFQVFSLGGLAAMKVALRIGRAEYCREDANGQKLKS
jgi:hypothetical protein